MAKVTETNPEVLSFDALDAATQQLVSQVEATRCPVVITRDGQAAVVLVEAREYDRQRQKLALVERILSAKREIAEGRFSTQAEVEQLLDEWSGRGD